MGEHSGIPRVGPLARKQHASFFDYTLRFFAVSLEDAAQGDSSANDFFMTVLPVQEAHTNCEEEDRRTGND